jgi:hypothetical protein
MTTETFATSWEIGPASKPPDVRGKDHDETVALMLRWWFENFEHPAASCPWENGEWIFEWGEPFDPRSELEWTFGNAATQNAIDAVVDALEARTGQWAPSSRRQRPISNNKA